MGNSEVEEEKRRRLETAEAVMAEMRIQRAKQGLSGKEGKWFFHLPNLKVRR